MAFDPDFVSMMQAIAVHQPVASVSGYGASTFGARSPFICHITYATKVVRGDTEETTTSTAQLQLPSPGYVVTINGVPYVTPAIKVSDNIILPDTTTRRVLDVSSPCDETGQVHHQSVSMT